MERWETWVLLAGILQILTCMTGIDPGWRNHGMRFRPSKFLNALHHEVAEDVFLQVSDLARAGNPNCWNDDRRLFDSARVSDSFCKVWRSCFCLKENRLCRTKALGQDPAGMLRSGALKYESHWIRLKVWVPSCFQQVILCRSLDVFAGTV